MIRRLLVAAAATALLAAPAYAQPPAAQYPGLGGTTGYAPATALVGFDSITGKGCIIGATATCQMIVGSITIDNVTLVGPTGAVAPASGISVTLDTTDAAALQSIVANTGGYSYVHITTSTTTVVKASPGTIRSVSVNSKGTIASTVTIKDDTTTLAVIDSLNLSGTWVYNIAAGTNITVVTTGTTPPDVTVAYQ